MVKNMKSYILQAVLNDQTVINLDFLDGLEMSLVGIDRYTNVYDFWGFLRMVEEQVNANVKSRIDAFQIAIKGKGYAYSVCFQNKYLEETLKNIQYDPIKRKNVIPFSCDPFIEMKEFLFSDFNRGGQQFTKHYSYRNRLSRLVHRYIQSYSDCEEDWIKRKELEREIIQEMREYNTYRSLCLYRKKLERTKDRYITAKPTPRAPSSKNILKPVIISEENKPRYSAVWENLHGDEREEFLDPEEIKQMVKSYGEN